MRALAALGRVQELEDRLAELRAMPPSMYNAPRGPASVLAAVMKLRAHGRPDDAAVLADRVLAAELPLGAATAAAHGGKRGAAHDAEEGAAYDAEAGLDSGARWMRVRLLYELGRWADAARVLSRLAEDADYAHRSMAALIAARRGDERRLASWRRSLRP